MGTTSIIKKIETFPKHYDFSHSKVLLRTRRKVIDRPNEWTTKSSRHLHRSNSYQPRTNTTFIKTLNRSNSYPYIQRY